MLTDLLRYRQGTPQKFPFQYQRKVGVMAMIVFGLFIIIRLGMIKREEKVG